MSFTIRSNIDDVLGYTARIHPQYRFSVALALTTMARKAKEAMPAALEADLDRPTPFSKNGFFIVPARKDTLQSQVVVKDKQSEYLFYQVKGGSRAPKKVALRLPTTAQLDSYGNLPAGTIKQLVERAKANKRATKRQSARFGVSRELDLFYGDPGDGRPAGIYKRVAISATRHQLIPVIVFPRRNASYKAKFDFFGHAERVARAEANASLAAAWKRALETAR